MSEELAKLEDLHQKGDTSVANRPEYWGGFRISPDRFEFWQGQNSRFHDRFLYRLNPEKRLWEKNYLAP